MQKRILSWVLALSMVATMFSCLGFSAFADETSANYTVTVTDNYDNYKDPTSDVEGYRQLNIQAVPTAAAGAGFKNAVTVDAGNAAKLQEASTYPSEDYNYKYVGKDGNGNSTPYEAQMLSFTQFIDSMNNTTTVYGRDSQGFYSYTRGDEGIPTYTNETEETAQHALSLCYDMGSVATVYDFVLGSQGRTGGWLATGYYSLYAADEKADLYKESSKLFSYNNSGKKPVQSFHFETGIKARYFALVIWDPVADGTSKADANVVNYIPMPRICMLKLFGTQKENPYTVKEDSPAQNDAAMFDGVDMNTIIPATPIVSSWSANSEGFDVAKYNSVGTTSHLNDGTFSGEFMAGNSDSHRLFANDARTVAYTTEKEAYLEIRYDFMRSKEIQNILVLNHGTPVLMTGYYQIFAGDDLATMFDEPLYTCKNYGSPKQRQLLTAKSQGSIKARYVAMRIYDPYSVPTATSGTANYENRYVRLLEFGVYGYTVEDNNYSVSSMNGNVDKYQQNVKIAESLIGDKNPVKTKWINKFKGHEDPQYNLSIGCGDGAQQTLRTPTTTKGVNPGNILVGDNQLSFAKRPSEGSSAISGLNDDETMQYGDLYYDLGGVADVNKIAFYGHTDAGLTVYHFRVSLANNVDDLFTENAVSNSIDLFNTGNYAIINLKEAVRAKYVGFRIICGLSPTRSNIYNGGDYARMCHLDVLGNKVETKKITFLDNMGKTIKELDVVTGATLTDADLNAVIAAVPEVYGYNFTGNWSEDFSGAITDDITVTPIYEKDTATTYTVKVTLTDGTVQDLTKNFDDRLELSDEGATYFKTADGAILGVGKRAVVYVCGDMEIVASNEAAPSDATVSITGATKSLSGGKNALNVFVHATTGGKEITEMGVIFISGTTYNTVKDTDWTADSLTAANKAFALAKSDKGYSNFMGRLLKITTEKKVTRVAKAYVTFSDGTTVYSDAKVVVFGE